MLLKIICLILPVVLISSCSDRSSSVKPNEVVVNSLPEQSTPSPDTLQRGSVGKEEKTQKDSVFILSATGQPLLLSGFLSKPGDVVTFSFQISKTGKLTGKIKVDTQPANIRFNQIVSPTGQSDGPFGQDMEYTLTEKGIYKIIIGHSLMAENAYVGPFQVILTLKE